MIKWKKFSEEEPCVSSKIVIKDIGELATGVYAGSVTHWREDTKRFRVWLDLTPDDTESDTLRVYDAEWCYLEEFLDQLEDGK